MADSIWWNGPSWLSSDQLKWPTTKAELTPAHINEANIEEKPLTICLAIASEPILENKRGDILSQIGTIVRLERVTAWILRFIHNTRHATERKTGMLTTEECLVAQELWVKDRQHRHFAGELAAIDQGEPLPKNSKLHGLAAFKDHSGILRCGGRLSKANISYDNKHPVILPPNDVFTTLVVRHAHKETLHGSTQHSMMQYTRNRFWITQMRRAVKKIHH